MATPMESLRRIAQSVRHPIDMSPEAVADRLRRLRRCAEISELCMKLKAAGKSQRIVSEPM
jgi:hypothetical protein